MDKSLILKQIKEYYNFKSDAEFANFLEITPQNLKHWYTRNTFNIATLAKKCPSINSEWLITGEGEMIRNAETTQTKNDMTQEKFFEALERRDKQFDELLEQNSRLISVIENMTGTPIKQSHVG